LDLGDASRVQRIAQHDGGDHKAHGGRHDGVKRDQRGFARRRRKFRVETEQGQQREGADREGVPSFTVPLTIAYSRPVRSAPLANRSSSPMSAIMARTSSGAAA
jgi:hypothetical protein